MDEGITRRYQDRNDNIHRRRRDNFRQKFSGIGTKTEGGHARRRVQDMKNSTSSEICSIYIDDCEKRLASIGDLMHSHTRFINDHQNKFRQNEYILRNLAQSTKPPDRRNSINKRFLLGEHDDIGGFEVRNSNFSQSKRRQFMDGGESSNTLYCYPLQNQDASTNSIHPMDIPNIALQNTEHYRRNKEMCYKEDPELAVKQNEYYPKITQKEKHYYANNHHKDDETGLYEKYPSIHDSRKDLNMCNPIRNGQETYERRAKELHEGEHRVRYNTHTKNNNFPAIPRFNTLIERNTEINKTGNTLGNRTQKKENYFRTDSSSRMFNVMEETKIQNRTSFDKRLSKNRNYNEASKLPLNHFKGRDGYNIQAYDRDIAKVYKDESKSASSIQLDVEDVMKSDNSLVSAESHSNSMGTTFERDVTIRKDKNVAIDDPKIIQIAKLILDCFQNDNDLESKYRETNDENNTHIRRNTNSTDRKTLRRRRTSKTYHSYTRHKIPIQRSDVLFVNEIVSQNEINYGNHVSEFDRKTLRAAPVLSPSLGREEYRRRSSGVVEKYRRAGNQVSTSKTTRRTLQKKYQGKKLNQDKYHSKNQSSSLEPNNITEKIREVSVQLENQLPLYDENAHLLGFLKEGTEIIGPSCPKSCDNSLYQNDPNCSDISCPFSICNKATQLKDVTNTPASARWTYGSNFESSIRHQLVKAKFNKCPKCVRCNESAPE
ncbi:hypothetical protein WDU94_005150 [Cyamophila willieti]